MLTKFKSFITPVKLAIVSGVLLVGGVGVGVNAMLAGEPQESNEVVVYDREKLESEIFGDLSEPKERVIEQVNESVEQPTPPQSDYEPVANEPEFYRPEPRPSQPNTNLKACQDLKAAITNTHNLDKNAAKVRHEENIRQINSHYQSRGLAHSGMHQNAIEQEKARYNSQLAQMEQQYQARLAGLDC